MIVIGFIFVCIGLGITVAVIGGLIYLEIRDHKRRKMANATGAPRETLDPDMYQSHEVYAAWRAPMEFCSERCCPHCGTYGLHSMSKPHYDLSQYEMIRDKWLPNLMVFIQRYHKGMADHPDAEIIRVCNNCQHMWGEK